ncbi:phage tail tape measure protein [Streptomyces sp. NPDC000994]
MALRVGELFATLRLDDSRFRTTLRGARDSLRDAGNAVARMGPQMTTTGDKIADVGKTITTRLSLPIAGVAGTALKMGGDFQASMNGVRAVTGATGKDFDDLRNMAKKMGAETQFSATDAAGAMEFLGMTGWKSKDIMAGLPDVLNLAAAGNTELATTADIASNIMGSFGIEATDMARVSDVLAQTMRSANVDLNMLGESMKYCAPLAHAAGWSLEETAAAVGFLGNVGIQGSAAGTGLNSMLATLADKSSTGGKKLKEFGVAATDSKGAVRPLTEIMKDLAGKGADVADVIGIFGLEAGPKMQALLGQGSKGLKKMIEDLENSEGVAKEMADIRMEGFNGSVMGLKSAFEGLMIAVADSGLLEWATKFADKITDLLSRMTKTSPEVLKVASLIGLLVAAIGPAVFIVGKMISIFGSSISTIASFTRGSIRAATAIGRMSLAVGRYAATMAATAARAIAAGVRMAASAVATAARVVAGWVLMGTQALIQGARMAAAWLLAMGPIPLIIAAIAGLVVLIIVYWDEIKEWTAKAWDWVVGKLVWAKDAAINAFMNFTLVGLIIKHWSSIKQGAQKWWNDILAWVKGIPGKLYNAFLNWTLLGLIIKHWSNIKTATVNKAGEMLAWVRGLPGRISSGIGNLGSLLYNKGMDVVRGLWNGIKSMGSWLRSQLISFAKSQIPGPIAKALGIASPSKLMADAVGRWIPAGIVDGIDAGRGALNRTMQNLVQPPPVPAFTGGAVGGAVGGYAPVLAGGGTGAATVAIEHWHAADNGTPDDNARALAWLAKARG